MSSKLSVVCIMFKKLDLIVVLLVFLIPFTRSSSAKSENIEAHSRSSEIFDQIFGKSYDREARPTGENGTGPLIVRVYLSLRDNANVNDIEMEFSVQMFFHQRWKDPRARYSHIENDTEYLILEKPERIWKPDLYFDNEKNSHHHQLIIPNVYTRVYADGTILQSYRLSLTLSCPMDFIKYPLDKQTCPIDILSYGWTINNLELKWQRHSKIPLQPVKMPKFRAISYNNHFCTFNASISLTGVYSCLRLSIVFQRNFGSYFIQMYIPCTLVVVVSWVAFYLEPTATEARVSLSVTTILTIVTQTYGINMSGTVPTTAYFKALDIWTAVCQILIFGCLIEFALVNYVVRYANRPCKISGLDAFRDMEKKIALDYEEKKWKGLSKAKRIDRIAKIGFPLVFFLFNITYWSVYLT